MSDTKHTPGPWAIDPHTSNGRSEVVYLHGDLGRGRIALVACAGTDHGDANARLIAAAPELLEACKLFRSWMLGGQPVPFSDSAILEIAEKAIAKAEGKT